MDEWSQHHQRISVDPNHSGEFHQDQHGRTWHAEFERANGQPCSPWRLAEPRRAPLVPPGGLIHYIRGSTDRGRVQKPYNVFIDYDPWIAQLQEGQREWRKEWKKEAGRHPEWDEATLAQFVGPMRGALLPAVKAAKAGNPYVLGLRDADPKSTVEQKLKALLEPTQVAEEAAEDWFADTVTPPVLPAAEAEPVTVRRPRGRPRKVHPVPEA